MKDRMILSLSTQTEKQSQDRVPARDAKSKMPSCAPFNREGVVALNNPDGFARIVDMMITNECPVACAHCVHHSGGKMQGCADPMAVRRIIKSLRRIPYVEIIEFTGGEPFEAIEVLRRGLHTAKAAGFQTYIQTSGVWAASFEQAMQTFAPLSPHVDLLLLSMDVFHQRAVSLNMARHAIRAAIENDTEVLILNAMTDRELSQGLEHSEDACMLAEEFDLPIQSWPVMDIGRAKSMRSGKPMLPADQPCGLAHMPIFFPNGEVYACCAGSEGFGSAHPLNAGNTLRRSAQEIVEKMNRNLIIQGIRTLGPLKLLQLLGANAGSYESQCEACAALCAVPEVGVRLRAALIDRPETMQRIFDRRRQSGDLFPDAHLSDNNR